MKTVGIIMVKMPWPCVRISLWTGSTIRTHWGQMSKPNSSPVATTRAAVVTTAAAIARHCPVSRSISGSSRPSCGLMVSRPKHTPERIGRRPSWASPAIINAEVKKPFWPANMFIHTAGATASMYRRSLRRPPSLAAKR